jgi:hypothetical protein
MRVSYRSGDGDAYLFEQSNDVLLRVLPRKVGHVQLAVADLKRRRAGDTDFQAFVFHRKTVQFLNGRPRIVLTGKFHKTVTQALLGIPISHNFRHDDLAKLDKQTLRKDVMRKLD